MAVGDIYRVTWLQSQGNENFANVTHHEQTNSSPGEDPEESLALAMIEAYGTDMDSLAATTTYLNSLLVKCIYPTPRQTREFSYGMHGSNTGEALPPNETVVTTAYTDTATKRGRGRNRWSGLTVSAITDSNVEATYVTGIQNFLNKVYGVFNATGKALVFGGRVWSAIDTAARAITYAKVQANTKTFRQRTKPS